MASSPCVRLHAVTAASASTSTCSTSAGNPHTQAAGGPGDDARDARKQVTQQAHGPRRRRAQCGPRAAGAGAAATSSTSRRCCSFIMRMAAVACRCSTCLVRYGGCWCHNRPHRRVRSLGPGPGPGRSSVTRSSSACSARAGCLGMVSYDCLPLPLPCPEPRIGVLLLRTAGRLRLWLRVALVEEAQRQGPQAAVVRSDEGRQLVHSILNVRV